MTQTDAVSAALARLVDLAPAGRREAVEQLAVRDSQRRLRVLVAGEAKRGKSTLLNRLLGRDVLPTGVLPVTAIATTIVFEPAEQERVTVHYDDGRTQTRSLDDLPELVTERGNPNNALGVADVVVTVATGHLARYAVELVDTPGTGSIFAHNTRAARDAYPSLDAVIVVVTADPPMSAADRDLMAEVSTAAVQTFVVINKVDRMSEGELAETVAFTAHICIQLGLPGEVFPMSARDSDDGLSRFARAFEDYLATRADGDAVRALAGHGRRLANRMRDEALVTLRAAELAASDGEEQVNAFTERIGGLTRRAAELDDRCAATHRRLLRTMNGSAAALISALVPRAGHLARTAFAEQEDGPADKIEQRGRQVVIDEITARVDAWRQEQIATLEAGVRELTETLNGAVDRQVEALRDAARDLLGVELASDAVALRLDAGRGFWYATDRVPSWELPGTELLRRHGPGATRRARERVLAEFDSLVDQQVGRARADLQQRLTETVRAVTGQLRRAHHDVLRQLGTALGAAADLAHGSAAVADLRRLELTDRIAALDEVMALLQSSAPVTAPS